jgi:ankyrin repeat protein
MSLRKHLTYLCLTGKIDKLEEYPDDDLIKNIDMDACIHYSCLNGHLNVVKYLTTIGKGFDSNGDIPRPHIQIYNSELYYDINVAFMSACDRNHLSIVKYLMSIHEISIHGIDHHNQNKNNISDNNYSGYDCFIHACISNNLELAKYLLTVNNKYTRPVDILNVQKTYTIEELYSPLINNIHIGVTDYINKWRIILWRKAARYNILNKL